MEKLYPAPWPEQVPTIHLETISVAKLLMRDAEECRKTFKICTEEGFFYLNLLDHPKGRKMWDDACIACQAGQETLPDRSIEEKREFQVRDRVGVFDRG